MKLHQTKTYPATIRGPSLSMGKMVLVINTTSSCMEITRRKSSRRRCQRVAPGLTFGRFSRVGAGSSICVPFIILAREHD